MKKLRIALAVAVALLGVLVTTTLFVEFDAPGLGQRVLDAAGRNAGITLQARSFRLHLRRGIVMDEVVATTEIASGTVVTTLDQVVLEHRLWPLLFGDIVIDRLVMDSPLIEVRNAEPGGASLAWWNAEPGGAPVAWWNAAPQTSGRVRRATSKTPNHRVIPIAMGQAPAPGPVVGRDVVVHAASIIDGTLVILSPSGEETTRVTNLDAEVSDINVDALARSVAVGLSAHGHLDVGEVHAADRVASGSRAQLTATAGIYTVSDLVLTSPEGKVSLEELVVDMNRVPYTYQASLAGNDLDLNRMLGIESAGPLGAARFEMQAAGAGPDSSSVVGQGRVTLAAGGIPDLPALDQVADLLGLQLAGLRYEATTIDFTLGEDRVRIAPFQIVSALMRVEASGDLDAAGGLDGRAEVHVPRDELDLGRWQGDFSDGIVDALTDETGWVSIPVVIGGTVQEPRVAPDADALLAALQQSAGRGLGKWLQGIIKRD